jgi:hypothetical protein
MQLSKDVCRELNIFHLVNPLELDDLQEFTEWLEAILHNTCYISEINGAECIVEKRQLVDRLNGLKIHVFPNEHPPPHFHVKSPNMDASFSIESCEILNGIINSRDYKAISFWHKHSKPILIKLWDESRPTECIVGSYRTS